MYACPLLILLHVYALMYYFIVFTVCVCTYNTFLLCFSVCFYLYLFTSCYVHFYPMTSPVIGSFTCWRFLYQYTKKLETSPPNPLHSISFSKISSISTPYPLHMDSPWILHSMKASSGGQLVAAPSAYPAVDPPASNLHL